MMNKEEIKESAETPYDIGSKGENFKERVTDAIKAEITFNNHKSVERENRNLGLNIDNTIQFIENEFLDIEKKIEHELTLARRVGFSRDSPFRRATDEYKKWVGMFKTNSNLRNMMFKLLLGERKKLYELIARTSELDKNLALLKAESKVLESKSAEYGEMRNALTSLAEEQKKLSSRIGQVVQPSLPDELIDSIKELKSSIEAMQSHKEAPKPTPFKRTEINNEIDDDEDNDESDEEPVIKKFISPDKAYQKLKDYLYSNFSKDVWKERLKNQDVRNAITEKTGVDEKDIMVAWERIKRENVIV